MLSGTGSISNVTTAIAAWPYLRGTVTVLIGTNAAVTVSMPSFFRGSEHHAHWI